MPKRPAIFLAIVILVYIAARLWRLTDSCLWFDEIFGVHAAELPWGDLIYFVAKDLIHPPLFYLLLKLWIAIGGESLLWLRLFPALFSVLSLVPLWMLGRELKLSPNAMLIVLGLFTVSGSLIKYAQEVRMYSMLLFFSLLSMWLFSRYYFRGKSFWVLVIANILLVHAHYFGWFVVITEVTAIAVAQRIKIPRTLLMLGATAAAFVPWIFAVNRFAEQGSTVSQNIGWMTRPGIVELWQFGFDLIGPFYFPQNSADPPSNYLITLPLLAVLAAAVSVYLVNFKREENKDRVFFLCAFAVIPAILAFALSWIMPVSIWGARHLLIVYPPVLMLITVMLRVVDPAPLRTLLLGSVAALSVAGFAVQAARAPTKQIWCVWSDLAAQWPASEQRSGPTAPLYVFEDLVAYHYWFETRRRENVPIVLLKNVEGMPNDPAYFLPRGFSAVRVSQLNEIRDDELWISFRQPWTYVGSPNEKPAGITGPRFELPVTLFENMGYKVEEVQREDADSQAAFLIRIRKVTSASNGPRP